MTTTDYIVNLGFAALVVAQALRERRLDRRAIVLPLVAVAFVAHLYLRSIPAAGDDLVLVGTLAAVGLVLGVAAGFATTIRNGTVRVTGAAAALLLVGICSRVAFAFAVAHGARADVAAFSIAHHIDAAAWPAAFVLMAVLEVTARVVTVATRGRMVGAG